MIGAVVLAAGESRRMGENKPLLEIGGRRVIELIISSFDGIADELIVVLGHKPESVVPVLKKLGARWVVNKNYIEGMASSFKKGLNELKHCDAVFLALGDQPFVDRYFLLKAVDAWKSGAKIVSPVYEGKKGHPVLFDKSLFDEILSLKKQEMVRDVIHRHADAHRLVEAGKWAVVDLDTPEDFRKILKK
jgi:molybdenum cofactor cytidylyltransferase